MFDEKVNENSKFRKCFKKFSKFRNFEFSSIFFFDKKSKFVWSPIFFDQKFSDFFRRKFFRPKFFRVLISIPNFPKIPKISLRTACDHYKHTNNEHEIKIAFILYYLTSGGSQVHEPSVYFFDYFSGVPPLNQYYGSLTFITRTNAGAYQENPDWVSTGRRVVGLSLTKFIQCTYFYRYILYSW